MIRKSLIFGRRMLVLPVALVYLLLVSLSFIPATASASPIATESDSGAVMGPAVTTADSAASGDKYIQFAGTPPVCTGVSVTTSSDIQGLINANPQGTTFCFAPGLYRLSATLAPKSYDSFIGQSGAVLNGSKLLTSFTQQGSLWVATGQTQNSTPAGQCDPAHPLCANNEGVFVDDQALTPVASTSALAPGTFYFDHPNNTIYLYDNPAGHKVEASVTNISFYGDAGPVNVHISGFVVEKFSTHASTGAITGNTGWVITNNEIRLNHGIGVSIFDQNGTGVGNWVISNNHLHDNGQMGLSGQMSNGLVENNEIDHNNTAGFWYAWEAGGAKWTHTTGLIVRGNYSHDNQGIGLWTDGYNTQTTYENNRVENNMSIGIHHEISYDATIRNNIIRNNGFGASDPDDAAIKINSSPNVEIYGNIIDHNGAGILLYQQNRSEPPGTGGPFIIKNEYVHDNTSWLQTGSYTGLATQLSDPTVYTTNNNRFVHNTYYLASLTGQHFYWMFDFRNKDQWQGYNQDTTGTFNALTTGSTVCPVLPTGRGLATATIDAGATGGTYAVWSRLNAPDANNNSYYLEVDGTNCQMNVGDSSSIPANAWTWVNYQDGNTGSPTTITLSPGTHTIRMIGREDSVKLDRLIFTPDLSCVPVGTGDNCVAGADTIAPTTSITSPANGAVVAGTINVAATASDNVGVSKVEFWLDGALASTSTTAPYQFSWNTKQVINGPHTLQTKAYDAAGNVGSSSVVNVVVNNDLIAPTVTINKPLNGSTVSGQVTIKATATDNVQVAQMKLYIDGQLKQTYSNVNSFSYNWNTFLLSGQHTIRVDATDPSGNLGSAQSTVTVRFF